MKYVFLLMFVSQVAFAHGGGEVEGPKIGKGITAYDKQAGFKLSAEALKRMQFAYKKVDQAGSITIPKEALVQALNEIHVYTHINDSFKAIDVKVGSKSKDSVTVSATGLKAGVEVVVKGVNFLRVIEMDLGTGDEHADEVHDEHGDEHSEGESEEGHHD